MLQTPDVRTDGYICTHKTVGNVVHLEGLWETGSESWTSGSRMGSPGALVNCW